MSKSMTRAQKIHATVKGYLSVGVFFFALQAITRLIVANDVLPILCNKGISFGVEVPTIIFGGLWIVFIGVMYHLWQSVQQESFLAQLPYIFIIAGALSNLADRFVYGCVVDYIRLVPWNVFNLADASIVIGAIMIVYASLVSHK